MKSLHAGIRLRMQPTKCLFVWICTDQTVSSNQEEAFLGSFDMSLDLMHGLLGSPYAVVGLKRVSLLTWLSAIWVGIIFHCRLFSDQQTILMGVTRCVLLGSRHICSDLIHRF